MPLLSGISSPRLIARYWLLLVMILSFMMLSKARAQELRILTWSGYAPENVISQFEQETGIKVHVTLTNNEDIITRLRANRGAGYDLVQPSMDQVAWTQQEFNIYKPLELDKINLNRFTTPILEVAKANTRVNNAIYGIPHVWGTNGLIVSNSAANRPLGFKDLCSADFQGKTSYRLDRPTLIGFAFAMGEDPFAAYSNQSQYQKILNKVASKLIDCKNTIKAHWQGGESLLNQFRTGQLTLAMGWDAGGWKLQNETDTVQYVAPETGALGWIDTFAIPANSKNDTAAYQWINFVMRPEIAAHITRASGQFTASEGSEEFVDQKLASSFKSSFTREAFNNIKWFPALPGGLGDIDNKTLAHIKAAVY